MSSLCPERLDRQHAPNIVLKDNDLNYRLCLRRSDAEETEQQLKRDSEFLRSMGLMDYSLLVGVHRSKHQMPSEYKNHSPRKWSSFSSFRGISTGRATTCQNAKTSPCGSSGGVLPPAANSECHQQGRNWSAMNPEEEILQSQICCRFAEYIEGPTVFYLGVVDILQEWNLSKRLERAAKILFESAEPDGLSAVEPDFYCQRFQSKVQDILNVKLDPESGC
eukprot:CAMPEP_0185790300 /NCGR_PEP_ID=MMETSP1174-20130828/155496_1 /TAXON_ID=35687 /ORGANISM="Dictyocha speculum, Strain CCMP1381" /LENGTH=220 /DNA_ID=CAMNT_0028484915 /DNA_START=181 /DNA_END=843 /DNA_ORIENTATION=+